MRIFSGIQPTGRKHLGNYIGAIRQYVEGQDRGEAIYCIVDLHAISVQYDPAALRERVYDTTAILLAAGLEPDRCILFRQSDVPEHPELTWLLSSVTAVGELNRMHQFRDKSVAQRELVSAALLFYPVLQAADVLAYRADEVPVGEDQREHLELMRDVARRFNARFGDDILVVPEHRIPEVGARIMDLQDPTSKMSTSNSSEEGTLYVLDDPAAIDKKFKRAVTDSDNEIRRAPDKPGVSNLIDILAAARGENPDAVIASLADARGYGDLKAATAQAVTEMLAPVQETYAQLRGDEARLDDVLEAGAQRAHAIAAPVVADVRAAMGFGPRSMTDVDLASFYDDSYGHEGADAEHWGQWRRLNARIKADKIVALWPGDPPATICEVGCGDAAILAQLADRGFGETFDGFEVSAEAAAIAARNPALRRVEAYDGKRLPVTDGAYDLGIVSHVLEHVPDPRALLAETARACRTVLIEVPLEDNLSARRPGKVAESKRIGHLQRFSRADMRALAAEAGLRVDGEIVDALSREQKQFLAPGAIGAVKWALRAGTVRVMTPLALRLFTTHYTALLTPTTPLPSSP